MRSRTSAFRPKQRLLALRRMVGYRRAMRGKGAAFAFVALFVLPMPSLSMAQEQGQVGGAPTANLPRKDFGRKTSDVIVIGTGTAFAGPVEIVAYRPFSAWSSKSISRPSAARLSHVSDPRLQVGPSSSASAASAMGQAATGGSSLGLRMRGGSRPRRRASRCS
jgi:hypothetical protein